MNYGETLRFLLLLLLGMALSLSVHMVDGPKGMLGSVAQAQTASASQSAAQLVQRGVSYYQGGQFTEAIAVWQQALLQSTTALDRAIIQSNLAEAYQQVGQLREAITERDRAIEFYRTQDDAANQSALVRLLVAQGQTYLDLGQNRRAEGLLKDALQMARTQRDRQAEAAAQGKLGDLYTAFGEYEQALAAYQASLDIFRSLNIPIFTSATLNNLGNLYLKQEERFRFQANLARTEGEMRQAERLERQARESYSNARLSYEESARVSRSIGGLTEATALLNLNRWLQQSPIESDRNLRVQLRTRIPALLEAEPDSRAKAFALINLARSLHKHPLTTADAAKARQMLDTALAIARRLEDRRAESYVLGSLGEIDEQEKRYAQALEWSQQAQFAAQQINAAESLYLWQWQAGRIFKETGDRTRAIAAYEQAIATLQRIRGDIVASNRELQFNFRDSVEPVYRELMALLLDPTRQVAALPGGIADLTGADLRRVLDVLDLLKLAELQNFFGDECVQAARETVRSDGAIADSRAAVLYSIILPDRTELIMQLPDRSLRHYGVKLTADRIQREVNQLRSLLEKRSTDEYLPQAQLLYDVLLRPLEADLATHSPRTLVLVNDGVLRNVPLAALHDGKQFFIEKMAIATTPSLKLTSSSQFDRDNINALVAGLTVARPPFAALINVANEADRVRQVLGGSKLLDQAFTLENLQTQLQAQPYSVIHLATHGQFGVDARSTFLLTYDEPIAIEQLDNLLRARPGSTAVELLTLSACQTAAGDNRTALGLAGVAVRAGVKSTLATLWFINDEATVPLIEHFYQEWRQPNVTKAEALRNAQLKLIRDPDYPEYAHPAVWSPFILVGNWL